MLGIEFYPTPKSVIRLMLAPYIRSYDSYNLAGKFILEPSAGKGDIADFVTAQKYSKVSVDCIELDPNLQHVLRGKGHSVVGSDFLNFKPTIRYDMILMNPPFSNGDEHLLHAWDIAANTDIVCILNAQTIRNPHTKRRQLLQSIISEHGKVEYHSAAFTQAERTTNVEIAIVRLTKKVAANDDPFFIDMEMEQDFTDFSEESMETGLSIPNAIQDHVRMYEQARRELLVLSKSIAKLHLLAKPILASHSSIERMVKEHASSNPKLMYNTIAKEINRSAWSSIFTKTKLERYMTSKVRSNFQEYTESQGRMSFNEENIRAMFDMLFTNRVSILEQALVDVFDILTKYHEDNRVHMEGWKTNDAHKVNRKVIVPYYIEFDDKYSSNKEGKYRIGYHRTSQMSDIDKALCLITGDQYGDITLPDKTVQKGIITCQDALEEKFNEIGWVKPGDKYDNTCSSHFFDFKFWKKGTLHMTFKDEWLWEQFNIKVAGQRNWLPTGYKNQYKPKFSYPMPVQ
jgi:predicted RNA methylase